MLTLKVRRCRALAEERRRRPKSHMIPRVGSGRVLCPGWSSRRTAGANGLFGQEPGEADGNTLPRMRAFALAEIGDREAIDVFLRREDAWAALAEILRMSPDWAASLFVVPIELDERDVSLN